MTLVGLLRLEDSVVSQASDNLKKFAIDHNLVAVSDEMERYHLTAIVCAFEAGLRTAAMYDQDFHAASVLALLDSLTTLRADPTSPARL